MARFDQDLTVQIPDCIQIPLYVSFRVKVVLSLAADTDFTFLRKTSLCMGPSSFAGLVYIGYCYIASEFFHVILYYSVLGHH